MSARKRVLVVDDDPDVRRLVAGVVVDAGYDAQTALDGEHAIRSVVALHPDLILLDLQVPERSLAFQFAEVYRERFAAGARAPIIAISGAPDVEAVSQQLGASGFLRKPFDVEELTRCVRAYLGEPTAAAESEPDLPEPAAGRPSLSETLRLMR